MVQIRMRYQIRNGTRAEGQLQPHDYVELLKNISQIVNASL